MHHLKRLLNTNQNSTLSPGLPLHYKNLFLLRNLNFKNCVKKKHISEKYTS